MISAGMKRPHKWALILGLTTKFDLQRIASLVWGEILRKNPAIPTTIKTMGVNITTIAYLRVLIIEIGSTIVLMVVEAQNIYSFRCFWVILLMQMVNKHHVPFSGMFVILRAKLFHQVRC